MIDMYKKYLVINDIKIENSNTELRLIKPEFLI